MSRNRSILQVESLESRDAPARLVNGTTLTYQDIDGDSVTVTFSKAILNASNANSIFSFGQGNVNGSNSTKQQLLEINLVGVAGATGTTITTSAARSAQGGNGFAALGEINAAAIDLGPVRIDGDLGKIVAGDATTTTSGLKGLTVQSMGRFGTSTGAPDLNSEIRGQLNFLKVKSDVNEEVIKVVGGVDGKIGPVSIGGSLIGGASTESGSISATGDIGIVNVAGNVIVGTGGGSGRIFCSRKVAGVKINGSLSGSILSDCDMGFVTIVGNISGISGVVSSRGKLAGISIGGSILGGQVIALGDAGSILVGGDVVESSVQLSTIYARRIASLTLKGSLIADTNHTDPFPGSGTIHAGKDLGAVLIRGSIIGNATHPVIISAGGSIAPTGAVDLAIGSLTVLGHVEYGLIRAGGAEFVEAMNADAQIGPVVVGGDWIASSIAAGAIPGGDNFFGDGDDSKMSGVDVKNIATISSSIASLTVGGEALGTVGGTDHYGIVAEHVGAVKIGGTPLNLSLGISNDDFLVGITGDLKVREI